MAFMDPERWQRRLAFHRFKYRALIVLMMMVSGIGMPGIGALAANPPMVVVSVDPKASTVTINELGQTKVYHMDPFGTVYRNGVESSLKDLAAGMVVNSLSLSDPDTINELKVSETAQPAAPNTGGTQYGSALPVPELAALMAKVGNSYWTSSPGTTSSPSSWLYLAADGKVVDAYHPHWLGKWTLADRYTLLLQDDAMQLSGAQRPSLFKFNASYTVAGDWVRQPVPTAEMQSKVARMNP
jgi:hypothetical protein